jgi:hypothetical protein
MVICAQLQRQVIYEEHHAHPVFAESHLRCSSRYPRPQHKSWRDSIRVETLRFLNSRLHSRVPLPERLERHLLNSLLNTNSLLPKPYDRKT